VPTLAGRQGKKSFQPKMFFNFYLPDQIPDDNFYKVLKKHLDLRFIYSETKDIYSHTGRPSLDPVVFFKCLLIGYLENICSDRALEKAIQLRLDLLYFIDHDIGEAPPDHSTICKTRKRIPTDVFEKVFNHVLGLCISAGLVKGDIQSIDTAYINANASLDKMVEVKMIDRDPMEYLNEVKAQDDPTDDDIDQAKRRIKKSQKSLEQFTEHRRKKYTDLEGGKPHKKNKRRFMSNATHMSRTDPDARIAKKSGKPRMLCYSAAMAVDTDNNVITHISAEHASKKDSRLLLDVTESTLDRLEAFGLATSTILADAGFSSGENYFVLNHWGLNSFIPIHGGFKEKREGFEYHQSGDYYTCSEGQKLHFKHYGKAGGYFKKRYFSLKSVCNNCSKQKMCTGTKGVKKIEHTIYREEYEEMIKRLKSYQGIKSYALRMQTVEPTFGTIQQHYGLRWINARGKDCANKIMLMAGAAVNLKKWMKKIILKDFLMLFQTIFISRRSVLKENYLLVKNIFHQEPDPLCV
jgi:transposase